MDDLAQVKADIKARLERNLRGFPISDPHAFEARGRMILRQIQKDSGFPPAILGFNAKLIQGADHTWAIELEASGLLAESFQEAPEVEPTPPRPPGPHFFEPSFVQTPAFNPFGDEKPEVEPVDPGPRPDLSGWDLDPLFGDPEG